jgi:transcriptional regulator with XRE-family HTH domain
MAEPDVVNTAIARNLRAERGRRAWTLDELAARSSVSKGMLIAIEQVRTNPSISTLCRISDAFGISLARLVEVAAPPVVRIVRRDAVVPLWQGEAGGRGELRFGADDPDNLELWHWEMAPGERFVGDPHAVGTRELLSVEAGTLTLQVDDDEHRIATGESVAFRADRPHGYANRGRGALRFVMVVSTLADPHAPDA